MRLLLITRCTKRLSRQFARDCSIFSLFGWDGSLCACVRVCECETCICAALTNPIEWRATWKRKNTRANNNVLDVGLTSGYTKCATVGIATWSVSTSSVCMNLNEPKNIFNESHACATATVCIRSIFRLGEFADLLCCFRAKLYVVFRGIVKCAVYHSFDPNVRNVGVRQFCGRSAKRIRILDFNGEGQFFNRLSSPLRHRKTFTPYRLHLRDVCDVPASDWNQ